jgi:hypothetical protein
VRQKRQADVKLTSGQSSPNARPKTSRRRHAALSSFVSICCKLLSFSEPATGFEPVTYRLRIDRIICLAKIAFALSASSLMEYLANVAELAAPEYHLSEPRKTVQRVAAAIRSHAVIWKSRRQLRHRARCARRLPRNLANFSLSPSFVIRTITSPFKSNEEAIRAAFDWFVGSSGTTQPTPSSFPSWCSANGRSSTYGMKILQGWGNAQPGQGIF